MSPSMKVPPKRKGNYTHAHTYNVLISLNESPSEKEGKSITNAQLAEIHEQPSMKVPPKRKGN